MAEQTKKKKRIDISTAVVLLILAALFDATQGVTVFVIGVVSVKTLGVGAFPGIAVNTFMNGFGVLFFGGIFWWLGVNYFKTKHAISGLLAMAIEFIPVLNILPAWTVYVLATIIMVRIEDGDSKLAKTALKAAKGEIAKKDKEKNDAADFKETPRNKRNEERDKRREEAERRREELREEAEEEERLAEEEEFEEQEARAEEEEFAVHEREARTLQRTLDDIKTNRQPPTTY